MIKVINKSISLPIQGVKFTKEIWKVSKISLYLEAALQMCYEKVVLKICSKFAG